MNQYSTIVYLYFLQRYTKPDHYFLSAIFHFHRFLALHSEMKWRRLFWYDGTAGVLEDDQGDLILRNLLHHQLVDTSFQVTEKGSRFLELALAQETQLHAELRRFIGQYREEWFSDRSCMTGNEIFSVACDLCSNRCCEDLNINRADILETLNLRVKGRKTPYRHHEIPSPSHS